MMMDNEEMNTALYQKMFAEQEKYRAWLLTQPAEEILKHTYEYTVREDIVMAMEYLDLPSGQAAALLTSPSPLGDVFQGFEKLETDYMDTLRDCIESRANDLQKARRELPVYRHSAAYAQENGELWAYRTSRTANIACKEAIETAISEHYSDNCLNPGGVNQVVDQFGYERTFYVLANTVQQKEWDGRFSPKNKDWAATVSVSEDGGGIDGDRRADFVVDAVNPGLTDLFINQTRRQYLLTQPLSKEDIQSEAGQILRRLQSQREPNSPKETHYMAQISPDFLLRASSKDQSRLFDLLPFSSLAFTGVDGRTGVYALISKEENRDKPLRQRRPSVRDKLQQAPAAPKSAPAHKKERGR